MSIWRAFQLGGALLFTLGAIACIGMLFATDRLAFVGAYLLCVFGARLCLYFERRLRDA